MDRVKVDWGRYGIYFLPYFSDDDVGRKLRLSGLCVQSSSAVFYPTRTVEVYEAGEVVATYEEDDYSRAATAAAKKICNGCPVKIECRSYAIEHEERYGVWGGTTPEQRLKVFRRKRGRREQSPGEGTEEQAEVH